MESFKLYLDFIVVWYAMPLSLVQSWWPLDAALLLPSNPSHGHSASSSSSRCNVLLLRGGRSLSLHLTAQPHQEEEEEEEAAAAAGGPSSMEALSALLGTSLELQDELGASHSLNLLQESSELAVTDLQSDQRSTEDTLRSPVDTDNLVRNNSPQKWQANESSTVESGFAFVQTREQLKYDMKTPSGQNSSLATLKGEIERRVKDQLAEKQSKTSTKAVKNAKSRTGSTHEEMQMPKVEQVMRDTAKGGISKMATSESEDQFISESDVSNVNIINKFPKTTHSVLRIVEAERRARLAEAQAALKSLELDRLRIQLGDRQSVIRDAEIAIARADTAQALLQKLEMDVSRNVPIDVHEQAIRRVRALLLQAQRKVGQITVHVKEKEEMLAAIKIELEAEQRHSLEKIRMLTCELSKRVPLEDMEIAIENALTETNAELAKAQKKNLMLSIDLEKKNRFFEQKCDEWLIEKRGLQLELETVKQRLSKAHAESIHDKAQLSELQLKVDILEKEMLHFRSDMNNTESRRDSQRQAMLYNIRLLVAAMMKISHAKTVNLESEDIIMDQSKDDIASTKVKTEGVAIGMKSGFVSVNESTPLSGQGTAYLQKFFLLMGQLISKETGQMNMETENAMQQTGSKSRENTNEEPDSSAFRDNISSTEASS